MVIELWTLSALALQVVRSSRLLTSCFSLRSFESVKQELTTNQQSTTKPSLSILIRPPFTVESLKRSLDQIQNYTQKADETSPCDVFVGLPSPLSKDLQEFLANYPDVTQLHAAELSETWTQPCHYLFEAISRAHHDWLLCLDSHVIFTAEDISVLLQYAQNQDLSLLSVMPRLASKRISLKIFLSQLYHDLLPFLRAQKLGDDRSLHHLATSTMMIARRQDLAEVEAKDPICFEIFEGMAIAYKMKLRGKPQSLLPSCKDIYINLEESQHLALHRIREGLAAQLAIDPGFVYLIVFFQALWFIGYFIMPWFASSVSQILFAAVLSVHLLSVGLAFRLFGVSFWPIIFLPLTYWWMRLKILRKVARIRRQRHFLLHGRKVKLSQLQCQQGLKLADLIKSMITG